MNRDATNEEYELNLAAFLWELLMRWKMLLIFGLIFAVLLAGFKYFRDKRAAAAEKPPAEILSAEEYEGLAQEMELEMEEADVETVIRILPPVIGITPLE